MRAEINRRSRSARCVVSSILGSLFTRALTLLLTSSRNLVLHLHRFPTLLLEWVNATCFIPSWLHSLDLSTSFIFLLAIISRCRLFHFFSVAAAAHLAVFILSLLDNTGTGRNLEISWFYFLQLYSTLSTLHFKECFSHVIREKNTVRIAIPDTHRR